MYRMGTRYREALHARRDVCRAEVRQLILPLWGVLHQGPSGTRPNSPQVMPRRAVPTQAASAICDLPFALHARKVLEAPEAHLGLGI